MVNTLSLHSRRKNPLWVAAYWFNQLKRAQVFETDISSTVDKIVRDEIDVVSYRVLSYLLLGLVRIYSRKVDYLSYDCNDMVTKVNSFFMKRTKELARAEKLRMSVTIPDKFQLDEFDLDELQDISRTNIASKQDITLQDVSCTSERFGLLSLEKFDDFDDDETTNFLNDLLEDIRKSILNEMDFEFCNTPMNIDQSDLMDLEFEVFRSNSPIKSLPGMDMDLDTAIVDKGAEAESSDLLSKDKHINADERVQLTAPSEDQIPEKCREPQKESVDIGMIFGTQNERVGRDDYSASMENMETFTEGPLKRLKVQENIPIQNVTLNVIPPRSENVDATPQSMFQAGSVVRPTLGGMSPNFMLIPTPALTEGGRLSRKRKTIDKTIIISNKVLKKNIQDATKLVNRRRKSLPSLNKKKKKKLVFRHRKSLRTLRRRIKTKSRFSRKCNRLIESLVPCKTSNLRFIFLKKRLRIRKKFKIVKTPPKSRVAKSRTVRNPKRVAASPKTPPRGLVIQDRPIEHPVRTQIENSDNLGPLTPHVSIELDQSLKSDEGLNPTEEFNVGNTISCESLEKERNSAEDDDFNLMNEVTTLQIKAGNTISCESLEKERNSAEDNDLNLMNEDISSSETENSFETENLDLIAGWSEKTGNIAKSLQIRFQDQRNKQEEEVVNFSQVVKGQTRKECAKLFYQMLVLKTTSCVDVEQNSPYADIAIKKQPKLDETLANYDDGSM